MSPMQCCARAVAYLGLTLLFLAVSSAEVKNHTVCFNIVTINRLYKQLATLTMKSGHPAWPPSDVSSFFSSETHHYILSLHLLALPNGESGDLTNSWLTQLLSFYKVKRNLHGSPFRKLVIIQQALGPSITKKTEYDFYPPILPVIEEVAKVKSGHPVDYPPTDDPNIELIRYPNTCHPKQSTTYDLVVVIASCVKCYHHRYWARKTFMRPQLWPHFKVGFVFLVGMPATDNNRIFDFYGTKIKQEPSYAGDANRDKITELLLKEADHYNDLLIGNFEDEFFNSTLRGIMGFRWAAFFCGHRTPLFLFLDTDFSIIPGNVMKLVRKIPAKGKPAFYGGHVFDDNPVVRAPSKAVTQHRWAVSEDEIPWTRYLPYVGRQAIFVGSQAVIDANIAMSFTRRFRILDVYLGIVFHRLHYKPVHVPHVAFSVDKCNAENVVAGPTTSLIPLVNWLTGQFK